MLKQVQHKYCIHSQGSLFNVHSHTHALVPAGIMKDGIFYEQRNISTSVIAEIIRARLLTVLLKHPLSPYESLVYYYGIYSSSHRGKERRENRCNQSIEIQETKVTGIASSTWARLIHRIFEVNSLRCMKCEGEWNFSKWMRMPMKLNDRSGSLP